MICYDNYMSEGKQSAKFPLVVANGMGGIAYASLLFQWIWSLIPIFYPFATSEEFSSCILSPTKDGSTPVDIPQTLSIQIPSGGDIISVIFMIMISLLSLAIIVYIIIKIPKTTGKIGQTITRGSAESITPIIVKNRNVKQKTKIIERVTWGVKVILLIAPLAISFAPYNQGDIPLTRAQVAITGAMFFIISSLLFIMQFVIAKLAKLEAKDIW